MHDANIIEYIFAVKILVSGSLHGHQTENEMKYF